jgi:prepilin-type N-terminal cleavage/methylation domain-containing protein
MLRASTTPRPARARRQAAFTLIELLTVMVIILILLSITIAVQKGVVNAQNVTKARGEIAALGTALDEFKAHYGDYPPTSDGVDATPEDILIKALTGRAAWEHISGGAGNAVVATFPGSKNIPMPITADVNTVPYKSFVDVAHFTVGTDQLTEHSNPVFLDPWGHAYFYMYKTVKDATTNHSAAGASAPQWLGVGYLLVSIGPDGAPTVSNQIFPESMSTDGIVPPDYSTSELGNADNIGNWQSQ